MHKYLSDCKPGLDQIEIYQIGLRLDRKSLVPVGSTVHTFLTSTVHKPDRTVILSENTLLWLGLYCNFTGSVQSTVHISEKFRSNPVRFDPVVHHYISHLNVYFIIFLKTIMIYYYEYFQMKFTTSMFLLT